MSQDGSDHCSDLSITPGLGTLSYRGWQFRLHLQSSPLSVATRRRKMTSSDFLQQIPVPGGTELRNPWQRNARYHPCIGKVEALSGRSSAPGRNLDRPQELGVLHDGQETQPSPSLLVSVLGLLQLQVDSSPQTLYEEAWRFITETDVTPQANFPQKITFDTLYTNEFVIRVRSRALSISSERNTIWWGHWASNNQTRAYVKTSGGK